MSRFADKRAAHWALTGLKFGYPVCCINSFIALEHMKSEWRNPWEGTGYVPCRECADKPMMQVQGQINTNRASALPAFPSVLV